MTSFLFLFDFKIYVEDYVCENCEKVCGIEG